MNEDNTNQGMETSAAPEASAQTVTETGGTPPTNGAEERTAAVSEEWGEDAILPDGWKPGDPPLLSTPDFGPVSAPEQAPSEAAPTDAANDGINAAPQTPPSSNDAPDSQTGQDGGETDWKALYEQEMARQADEAERQNAEKYRSIVQDLMENQGTPEALAKLAAANECGGKNYPLSDAAPEAGQAATPAAPGGQARKPVDYAGEIHRIHLAFPDAREMPADVTQAILRGEDGVAAYGAYQSRAVAGENAQLKAEIARLRSQLDASRRAPVRGVTGENPQQKPKSDFERGFDAAFD